MRITCSGARITPIMLVAFLVLFGRGFAEPIPKLTYLTEDYPPANYSENGNLKGLSVDLLRLIWKKMGMPEQSIAVVPWSRGYAQVQNVPGTVLFTMSRTPARDPHFKWVGPLFTARHDLISLRSRRIHLDSLGSAKKFTTAVVRDDISEVSMKSHGFPDSSLVIVARLPQALDMLLAGRIHFACVSNDGFVEWAKSRQLDTNQFIISANVNEMSNFYAFHKSTPDSIISRFQIALDSLKKEQAALLIKYGLSL